MLCVYIYIYNFSFSFHFHQCFLLTSYLLCAGLTWPKGKKSKRQKHWQSCLQLAVYYGAK